MWILWAVLAAISAALVIVLTKAGLADVDPSLAFAIQSVLILLITWTVVVYQGNFNEWRGIGKNAWMFIILAGICTSLSTLFSYKALSMGPASSVATIERSSLILAIILSVIFLKEKVTWQILLGGTFMVIGAILIAFTDVTD